jgi:hypothetical protein
LVKLQWVGIVLLAMAALAWLATELIWRQHLRSARLYTGPASGIEPGRSPKYLRIEWYKPEAELWVRRAQQLWLVAYASTAVGATLLLFGTA